jgi:hypothetical protein
MISIVGVLFLIRRNRPSARLSLRVPRHSVGDSHKFLERRIRLSALGKNIQGLLAKTGACLLSPADTCRRQRLPTLPALLKPFGGMRRIGAAEHFITLGERIVAIEIFFAGLDYVEQMYRALLAKRCPGVVSRLMLKIGKDAIRLQQVPRKIFPRRLRSNQIDKVVSGCECMRKSSRYPIGPAKGLCNLPFQNPERPTVIDRHRAYLQEFARNRDRS